MLKKIELHNVGPAEHLAFEPVARRFNLITGDNGLGKSFLLEAAWWALTRTWHEHPAVPTTPDASIEYSFDGDQRTYTKTSPWVPAAQQWKRTKGRPPNPGLVLYARVDGSFSVWDPARNYRLYKRADGGESESPAAYQFTSSQVLNGLKRKVLEAGSEREQVLCNGLIDDWTRWQDSKDPRFELLKKLLARVGPDDHELKPGEAVQPSLDDDRRIPTICMPYGQEVPITYAPAGVRRMCMLTYLLAWSLAAHKNEAVRIGQPLARQIIVLIDEPETHLHPKWQRTVLPSLIGAIESWDQSYKPEVQFIVATHSPLILASMEPHFDSARDALWKLDLVGAKVEIAMDAWRPRGDVNRWLQSDVFDLRSATSSEAEGAMKRASALLGQASVDQSEVNEVDGELVRFLPEMDPFFVRWRYYMGGLLDGEVQ